MRGEDITAHCVFFDPFISQADCPTIAIGDGGNEIGMGNIAGALADLDISASVTRCDELLVADVSNWGAYGLIAFLALWAGQRPAGERLPGGAVELSLRPRQCRWRDRGKYPHRRWPAGRQGMRVIAAAARADKFRAQLIVVAFLWDNGHLA